jgi:hypothetical protein
VSLILRASFVLLLALGLAERAHWYQAGAANRNPTAALAAAITSIGLINFGADPSGLLETAAPGCPALIPIGLEALDGSEDARFSPLLTTANRPLFIYLGHLESHRDSRRAVTAWLAANARTMLYLRPDQAPNKLVLAVLPATCPTLAKLNWPALSR